jgi:hypothetical protein
MEVLGVVVVMDVAVDIDVVVLVDIDVCTEVCGFVLWLGLAWPAQVPYSDDMVTSRAIKRPMNPM